MWTLLKELQVEKKLPTTLYYDNQTAIHISKNTIFHEKTKHIEINFADVFTNDC